ncbi:PQQ-binding-like beta-propeller repeat protein [Amycolatopsis sp. NPDC051903]|uniref:outer membrane protein assembly factor BamB family protein n=1 Tax=Amycolatopsis sp. NPDC051903 TaxID=3363936 RepID=UPI003787A34D
MGRRGFLGLAAGAVAVPGLASVLGAAPAGAVTPARGGGLRFAAVSDTHVNTTSPQSTAWLTLVYQSIARREPDLVLHSGDITDTGLPDEYEQYGTVVPDALRGRIHYSPGNHETRWDPSAKEEFHGHFGPTPYSFDAGGVHFVGFDPTQVLQEPGHYGPAGLDWLDRDLRGTRPGTPVVLFQHFPFGNEFYYVDDQPAVLDVLAGHNLRGIVAGHVHRENVTRFNGLTQVTLNAVLNGPTYYWAEKTSVAGTPVLAVRRVTVAADGTDTEAPFATIPLAGAGQGREQQPRYVHLNPVAGGQLPVEVRAQGTQVGVQPYPQAVFGGSSAGAWQPLAADRDRWTGTVDVSALAPGRQRLQVRVSAADGSWWEQVALFTVPAKTGDPASRWQQQLSGSVQGGVSLADARTGRVLAASTAGEVTALDRGGHRAWRTQLGPVYRRPAVGKDLAFVPSADHHLYALDVHTGRRAWAFDAQAPVLSAPSVTTVDGQEQVVFSAGEALFAVGADGRRRWSVPGRGFSSGQAASDGDRVYTSAADGYARAHDARTGAELWAYRMVTGVEHRIALYSGWDTVVATGGDVVIVATVSSALALDRATGALRWTVAGSAMYAPALITGTSVLLTTEWGVLTLVDLATGKQLWQTNLALRVFNAGVAISDGTAWVLTVDGKVIGVRLADGARLGWLQQSLVYTFGRPVLDGKTLVVGDQNGAVHGISLP